MYISAVDQLYDLMTVCPPAWALPIVSKIPIVSNGVCQDKPQMTASTFN